MEVVRLRVVDRNKEHVTRPDLLFELKETFVTISTYFETYKVVDVDLLL